MPHLRAQFAADEDSGGCVVKTDPARGHRSVPLGGDKSRLNDKGTDVPNLAWRPSHELEVAVAVADHLGRGDGAGGNHRHGLTVQQCTLTGNRRVLLVEIGEIESAEKDLAVSDEPNRDAPEWLMVGEVARSINGVYNPVSSIRGGGMTVLFTPETCSRSQFEKLRLQEAFNLSVDVGDQRSVAFDFDLEGASAMLGDFGRLAQESHGFAQQGGLIHDWFNYARSVSVPGHPAQFGAWERGCGIFSEPRAGVAQW